MNFNISKIILWSKDVSFKPREIDFKLGKINVITGDSERGKSALIAIVDYVLCSSKCQIPVGIRDYVEWFGVLFKLDDSEILLARKEPGVFLTNGDMFSRERKKINTIPTIIEKTTTVESVKIRLNEIAGLSDLEILDEEGNQFGFGSKPSFRDMVSFLFQPQYIIANQRTLFYKTDSYEHREKIRNIFPYVLGAIDNETLRNQQKLKELRKELKSLEKDFNNIQKGIEKWLGEIRGIYMQAKEYGLLTKRPYPSDKWKPIDFIRILKQIPKAIDKVGVPLIAVGSTDKITDRISVLKQKEISFAKEIEKLRSKQSLIKGISKTNNEYTNSILIQNERLKSVGWFKKRIKQETDCPLCGTKHKNANEYIDLILNASKTIETKAAQANDTRIIFDNEIFKINSDLKTTEKTLNEIRQELNRLLKQDSKYKNSRQTINNIYRFVGELEAKISAYDVISVDGELIKLINKLSNEIKVLEDKVDNSLIKQKEKNALNRIRSSISYYSDIFKAERYNDPVGLNIMDLTLDFGSDTGRVDKLWEIGSGSNYMAYHISTMLALHELFLRHDNHPVPNFIFFDQPSQAYFPEMKIKSEDQISDAKQEDILRVKRIFQVLSNCLTERTDGKLQIIVLEHAGPSIWDEFSEVHKVARWRDDEEEKALIPEEWMN
ncbi:DUF3732 domain-containing protein [uncultured Dokdonia sp.]|uniref:DUF3732 domain-containing protein n=1 Tax=uncultured Dokdonia sp. TaxID=575653 RepID=UPI00262A5F31|nr:DUF3732 domain-containing protein [uncultured Dokdonia sp.]